MTAVKYSLLEKYADIKQKIRDLESQAKAMEIDVIKTIDDVEGKEKKLETTYGKFQLMNYTKWEYSKELQEKELLVNEQVKLMKHKEEVGGQAILVAAGYTLRVTLPKKG